MVNWCSSACIVQAGHAGSLYVNTSIFMVWFDKSFFQLLPGPLRRGDGQDPGLRGLRLRPVLEARRHRRGSTPGLPARPRVDHRQVEGAAEHRRRRRRKSFPRFYQLIRAPVGLFLVFSSF